MKILIISLLRIGDFLTHIKAIESFKEDEKIQFYFLTHKSNSNITFIAPWIKHLYYFDRELVQKSQKECFTMINNGLAHTKTLIEEINQNKFDFIFNFTNTKTSAYFTNELHANHKIGLIYKEGQFSVNDPSQWFIELNNKTHSKFNFIDIFKQSLNNNLSINLNLTLMTSREKIKQQITSDDTLTKSKLICFQLTTSDIKKNGNLLIWKKLILHLILHLRDFDFKILCAPDEFQNQNSEWSDFIEANKQVSLSACTFKEALTYIRQAQLLVTLDTSIKHLASFSQTPIFEIPLGSSNPIETGAYSAQSYMYFKPIECQPCKHSAHCDQQYKCHKQIDVYEICRSIIFILEGNEHTIEKENHEFKNIYKTKIKTDPIKLFNFIEFNKLEQSFT